MKKWKGPMWKRRLKVAHASLKDKATPAQVAQHMQRIVDRQGPHLILTTEAQKGDSQATSKLLGPTYDAARAGGRMAVWKVGRLRLLKKPEYIRLTWIYEGNEVWRDLHVTIFDFEDTATGLWFRVIVPHLASGVEMGDSWKPQNTKGRRVHDAGWPQIQALAVEARSHGYEVIVAGDGNLNLRRPVWRRYVEGHLRGLTLVWKGRMPKRGSHGGGGRLIDFLASNLAWTKGWVMPLKRRKPMDHDVIIGVLNLTPALNRLAQGKKKP